MKKKYLISIGIIIILYLVLLIMFIIDRVMIADILSLSAIFVALITGLLAVSISDKKQQIINFTVKIFANKTKGKTTYQTANLPFDIRSNFQQCGSDFSSYKVYFKITNTSKFALKKPTVTLKIPNSVKHPSQDLKSIEIRSNLYNSISSLQALEYGNTTVISNSNLPYLHSNETIKIWVRMMLDREDDKKLIFHVALDSDNAEGKNLRFKMTPKEILNNSE